MGVGATTRLARKVLDVATAVFAVMAFTTTSAFAQSIEVHPEGSETHCSDVTTSAGHAVSGGCSVHITSEGATVTMNHNGVSEVATSSCSYEFTGHIDEEGDGYLAVNDSSISGPNPPCQITPCDEDTLGAHPELEWPISGILETGGAAGGGEVMIITFCVRPAGAHESEGNTICTLIADITHPTAHQQELSMNEEPCLENPANELSGHWITEAVPSGDEVEIEIEHTHYL